MKQSKKKDDYLYHYTSIDGLLMILKNKTIKFSSLLVVDDLEEKDSLDIKNIGKVVYVSCWTKYKSESIPMWNMYTPGMQGVRIKLKKMPFKKYHYNKGEYNFKESTDSYINFEKIYAENKYSIVPNEPRIIEIEYTNNEKFILPRVKEITEIIKEELKRKTTSKRTNINLEKIGKYKRESWKFQKEVRYILIATPWGIRELAECKSLEEQMQIFNRIIDSDYYNNVESIYLELDEEALNEMEIMIGPKATETQKNMVSLIVNEYCPKAKIKESTIKIR